MEVGPALPWGDVYGALEPYGKIAIGGRLTAIGNAGLTLGGGIHYFANKYGFAMDNVLAYEVVTADGQVITASATSNQDLFWALKGGSNNFGIVTKFTYRTFDVPKVSTQMIVFTEAALQPFTKAISDLGYFEESTITAAGGIFSFSYDVTTGVALLTTLGVQEGATLTPSSFANFSAIPAQDRVFGPINNITTLAQAASILPAGPYQYARWASQTQHNTWGC